MYPHVYNKMFAIIYFRRVIKIYILGVTRVFKKVRKPKTIEAKRNM